MIQPAGFDRTLVDIRYLRPLNSPLNYPRRLEHACPGSCFTRERYRLRRTRLDDARESRDVPMRSFICYRGLDIAWRGTYDTKPGSTSTSGLIGVPSASTVGSRLKTAKKDAMVSQTEFSPMYLPGHTLKVIKLRYERQRRKPAAKAYRRPAPNAGTRGSGTDGSSSSFPSTSLRKRSGLNTSGSG
jgi:hypothetical protein